MQTTLPSRSLTKVGSFFIVPNRSVSGPNAMYVIDLSGSDRIKSRVTSTADREEISN